MTKLTRRSLIALIGAAGIASAARPVFAQGVQGKKFIFVILRGAMDGLSALIPDDREAESLRGTILPEKAQRLDLGNGFRLHPNLIELNRLYRSGDAAFVHAASTSYRQRSHFDGQDVLETLGRSQSRDGWLNRVVAATGGEGLAVGYALPMALKGAAPASNWSPPVFPSASEDLLMRLSKLYASDPVFAEPLAMAMAMPQSDINMKSSGGRAARQQNQTAMKAMGELMAVHGGPGIGMISLDGWDTHANQAGALNARFASLDGGVAELKRALGNEWSETCVVICSEFGRTAAVNGTRGTDHGTGGLMMLLGGALNGGHVHGDWPGLSRSNLYEGRDLAPANDVTAVLKGILRDHLGIDRSALNHNIFPGSQGIMDRLV